MRTLNPVILALQTWCISKAIAVNRTHITITFDFESKHDYEAFTPTGSLPIPEEIYGVQLRWNIRPPMETCPTCKQAKKPWRLKALPAKRWYKRRAR